MKKPKSISAIMDDAKKSRSHFRSLKDNFCSRLAAFGPEPLNLAIAPDLQSEPPQMNWQSEKRKTPPKSGKNERNYKHGRNWKGR